MIVFFIEWGRLNRYDWLSAMEYEARDESRHGILSSRIVGFASESLRDESVHSVTLKPWKPATASMHDYVSLSKYYWPVEGKPELPWAHQSGKQYIAPFSGSVLTDLFSKQGLSIL